MCKYDSGSAEAVLQIGIKKLIKRKNMFKDKMIESSKADLENLSQKTKNLLENQVKEWELAKINYKGLESVKVREFLFDGFKVKVQFNSSRIISTSAKVDAKSINERKCFLCSQNLPSEQKGIGYREKYIILVNPFPIFPEHFTIPKIEHVPQRIKNSIGDILDLSKDLKERYIIFYNGPRCGASAPDHMHFQAGLKEFMPIDTEYDLLEKKLILKLKGTQIFYSAHYLRNFISIEGSDKAEVLNAFLKIFDSIQLFDRSEEEPMMNVLASFQNESWRVIVFPRNKHRPQQYFEDGEKQILLSPASVDFGGVCITPREEDFNKITKDDIVDIFNQVSVDKEKLEKIIAQIK